jgi:hypothetical protein
MMDSDLRARKVQPGLFTRPTEHYIRMEIPRPPSFDGPLDLLVTAMVVAAAAAAFIWVATSMGG